MVNFVATPKLFSPQKTFSEQRLLFFTFGGKNFGNWNKTKRTERNKKFLIGENVKFISTFYHEKKIRFFFNFCSVRRCVRFQFLFRQLWISLPLSLSLTPPTLSETEAHSLSLSHSKLVGRRMIWASILTVTKNGQRFLCCIWSTNVGKRWVGGGESLREEKHQTKETWQLDPGFRGSEKGPHLRHLGTFSNQNISLWRWRCFLKLWYFPEVHQLGGALNAKLTRLSITGIGRHYTISSFLVKGVVGPSGWF